ncbi:hypothetical protein [Spirochaeta cellobiosiphila]|uniref:hypothetical protein n=1 Tax=Spirochaeta cellobiosiphila TaxID=504483 RepID=UPI000422DE58|nr:hypothetical protein [Spirochaeta cellobiosiphila]
MATKDNWIALTSTSWQDFYRSNEWVGLTEVDMVHQVVLQGLISINRIIKEISIYNRKTYFDLFQGITELESLLSSLFERENTFLINHQYQDSDNHIRHHYHIIKELNKLLLDNRMMVKYSINHFFDNIVPLLVSHFEYDLHYYNMGAILGSHRNQKGQSLVLPHFHIQQVDALVKGCINKILTSLKSSGSTHQEVLVKLIKKGINDFYKDFIILSELFMPHYKVSLIQKDMFYFESIILTPSNRKEIYKLLIGEWVKKLFYYKSTLVNRFEWLLGLMEKNDFSQCKDLFYTDSVGDQFLLRLIDMYLEEDKDEKVFLPLLQEEIQTYIGNRYLAMDDSIEMQPYEIEILQQNLDTITLYIEEQRSVDKKIFIEKIMKTIIYQFEDFKVVINDI